MEKNKKRAALGAMLIFATLSALEVVVHDWFVDSRVRDVRQALHAQVIAGRAPAPIQYRVFVHYAAEGLMRAGFSFDASYGFIRFVFTFLAARLFYLLMLEWFAPTAALAGAIYLFAAMPLTYIRYYMQPMDMPNLFFFVAGMTAALKRKYPLFLLTLAAAMFNRETAILLVFIWLFANWDKGKNQATLLETSAAGGVGLGIYFVLRKLFALKPYYSDLFYLGFNLSSPHVYLYAALLFGPFIFYAFGDFSSKPEFLRRAVLVAPFFLVVHYTMTIMAEPRLWLPLLIIIIPLGLWSMVAENMRKPQAAEAAAEGGRRKNAAAYFALLAAFAVFFVGFFFWYEKAHLGNRRDWRLGEKILSDAAGFSAGGWDEAAVGELEKGAALFPDNAEFRYRLGIAYSYRVPDAKKALENYKKTLELEPYHIDGKRIAAEIKRLEYYEKTGR